MMGGFADLFIYPLCVMPVVLLASSRVVSFVRNYYLEYDESDDEDKPYLAFFLQTVFVGAIMAAVIYLCGQLVLGAAYPDGIPVLTEGISAANATSALHAQLLSGCFGCAAAVTFACCALSVIYLKLLFWRDEHDLNTSGIAMSVSAVFASCVVYSVASALVVVWLAV